MTYQDTGTIDWLAEMDAPATDARICQYCGVRPLPTKKDGTPQLRRATCGYPKCMNEHRKRLVSEYASKQEYKDRKNKKRRERWASDDEYRKDALAKSNVDRTDWKMCEVCGVNQIQRSDYDTCYEQSCKDAWKPVLRKRYLQSEKGKATKAKKDKKYRQSARGKRVRRESTKRWLLNPVNQEKRREWVRRYSQSTHGKQARIENQNKKRAQRVADGICVRNGCGRPVAHKAGRKSKKSTAPSKGWFCAHCLVNQKTKRYMIKSGDLERMLADLLYACPYSGNPIDKVSAHIEHTISQKWCSDQGYPPEVYNNPCNLSLTDRKTNSSMGDGPKWIWMKRQGRPRECWQAMKRKEAAIKAKLAKIYEDWLASDTDTGANR